MKLNILELQLTDELKGVRKKYGAHVGTHIDTYRLSYSKRGAEEVEARILDVRGKIEIGLDCIKDIELEEFIIFRTGYMENYGYGTKDYFNIEDAPYLSIELVDRLIERKVKYIGIDLHGIRHSREHKKVDIYCEDRGVYVVENICNLDKIGDRKRLLVSWNASAEASAIPLEISIMEV